LFHFYPNEKYQHLLSFISVIFYDRDRDGLVEEPLLCGGWFDYGKGNKFTGYDYDYPFALCHIKMSKRRDDGSLISEGTQSAQKILKDLTAQKGYNIKVKVKRMSTLAVHLITITKADELKERVIAPLLDGIKADNG